MTPSQRLSPAIHPRFYQLDLSVYPEEKRFSGKVSVTIDFSAPTREMVLHALDLEISHAALSSSPPLKINMDPDSETVTLLSPEAIPAGTALLSLFFSGKLNAQLRGLYAASHQGETWAFTQFEPTDARRMFPCFDEPGMKAKFQLTVTIPSHLTALSNMPAIEETTRGDKKTVRFMETPLMSTYLLALAVAQLVPREIQVAGVRVAVWTTPEELPLATFALEVTAAALPLLNDYFALPYPYPKLDLVSVPDFAMGAMENWGAIFFRDSRLLLDETLAATSTKRVVANVIVHELVHQWFGNLVTMAWWDDLWLNEAFATWLACKIVDTWRPEWNSWVEFQQEKQIPLAIDALKSTRPIHAEVTEVSQIEAMFDAITYEKGAACLRMIEQFLSEAAFRTGIQNYMRAYQFQNATAHDFWKALSEAATPPIFDIAKSWFEQGGFPLVTLSRKEGKDLVISQRPFQAMGDSEPPPPRLWTIPFQFKYRAGDQVYTERILLSDPSTTHPLPDNVDWVYGNAEESGFYRIEYEAPLRQAIHLALPGALNPSEKIGHLNHLWAMTQRGDLPIIAFMETMMRFRGDKTRVVVEEIRGYLEILFNQMVLPEHRPHFAALVQGLLGAIWKEFGWDPGAGEDDELRLTRASLLWSLGALAQDEDILSELPRRQQRFWAKPESLDPTLATTLMRLCARVDGGNRFNLYLQKFQSAKTPEERDRYLQALADFSRPALAQKLLEFSLSEGLRSQDVWKPVRFLLANPSVQEITWEFVKAHWPAFHAKGGSTGATRIIQGTRALWKVTWGKEVRHFFNQPENQVPAAERALAQTVELIEIGSRFKERQQETLARWLQSTQMTH